MNKIKLISKHFNIQLMKKGLVSKSMNPQHTCHDYSTNCAILGIETSCDDTGCAIVNHKGDILAETLHSQNLVHLRNGGIIPDIAQDLHRRHIEPVVAKTLSDANMTFADLTAIAVTSKPGLPLSLAVGVKYAKHLALLHRKPLIPIHHMEAHALVSRMEYDIKYPFLVLLVSGGHCLLAVAQDVNDFLLLGESIDCAPGDIFDKIARCMKLRNIPEYSKICGGEAIELAATKATDVHMFQLPVPLVDSKDCNFSFNGLKTATLLKLHRKECEHNIVGDVLIPEVNNLCATLLINVTRHLIQRTERAIEFCISRNILPVSNKQLVISGGVACNNFIFKIFQKQCKEWNFNVFRPKPKLCTDNGIMIAWNGIEKWRKGIDIMTDFNTLNIESKCPLGRSLLTDVAESRIKIKVVQLKDILQQ